MRKIKYFAFNIIFAASLYFGLIQGFEPAANVALFIAWATIIISFCFLSDAAIEVLKKESRAMPAWFNGTLDLVFLGVLVWTGYFITSAFYVVSVLIAIAAWDKAEKEQEA